MMQTWAIPVSIETLKAIDGNIWDALFSDDVKPVQVILVNVGWESNELAKSDKQ